MAIKIIKEGKVTKFTKTCPDCGCEFEYETSDLHTDYSVGLTTNPCQYNTYVICPCCKRHIHHGTTWNDDWPRWPQIYYTTSHTLENKNNLYDCDTCPNKPNPLKPVFGDTPCTWCPKMQPTCSSTFEKIQKNL